MPLYPPKLKTLPDEVLLGWVTEFGAWPSSENDHLYYRLRQSYGDMRLLHEAPGHFCLNYEAPEIVTLIYLSLLFGWDVHLLPVGAYGWGFLCHDEWVELDFDEQSQFDETKKTLEEGKIKVTKVT